MRSVSWSHAVRRRSCNHLPEKLTGMPWVRWPPWAQVHPQHGVAGLQHGEVDGHVGLRAGVRLHVGVLGAEELLGALDGEFLDDVDVLAAAVVAPARAALRRTCWSGPSPAPPSPRG